MSLEENMLEIQPMKININDIFDKKIEIGPLLEFKLLQKIIEEFINRQNITNNKIDELEQKILNIENIPNISNINYSSKDNLLLNNILDEAFSENDLNENKDDTRKKEKKDEEIKEEDNKNKDNMENDDTKTITLLQQKKSKDKKIKSLFQQMIGKINILENKYNELLNQFDEIKKDSKNEFKSLQNKNEESLPKNSGLNNQINEIQNKTEEAEDSDYINIMSEEDGDLDINKKKIKVWIKKSENKLTKKIEISNKKNKNLEISLNEAKNEINYFKSKLNNYELKTQSKIEKDDKQEETKNIIENYIRKEDLDKTKNKIIKLIDEINNKISKNPLLNLDAEKFDELLISKLNKANKDLKENFSKSIENNEKYVKNQIKKMDIDSVKAEIVLIRKELNNKLNKENFGSINLKLEEMETYEETLKKLINDHTNEIRIFKDKFAKLFTVSEDLRSQVFTLFENVNLINKKENESNKIDLELLISKSEYDEDRERMNKKIDKALAQEIDNYRAIQEIQTKLKKFVIEADLQNLEKYLLNVLDENKKKIAKNYVEKSDLKKNLKLLELKIKTLEETGSKDKENCFLAKKPMSGFLCASCETYVGDLKNNEEVATWNKLNIRKDKKNYRLGHGFSTMIKMLNTNLLKKFENRSSDSNDLIVLNNSRDLKSDLSRRIKKNLPKINLTNHISNINETKNINISLNMNNSQNEEIKENLNNISINLNNNSQSQLDGSGLNNKANSSDKANNENNIKYTNNDISEEEEQPKVIKISKKIKKV